MGPVGFWWQAPRAQPAAPAFKAVGVWCKRADEMRKPAAELQQSPDQSWVTCDG